MNFKGTVGKRYTSANDFFDLNGNIVMWLTREAAIEVCLVAIERDLLVMKIEGGFWLNPYFEARVDCIWDGYNPPNSRQRTIENNFDAAQFIRDEPPEHDLFVITTARFDIE
jgi:hypothetical protein